MSRFAAQRGMVLIIVLWFIVLVTILIFTLASETRLSADIVRNNKLAVIDRAALLKALRMAEMELLLARMPEPVDKQRASDEVVKNPLYRFDGRPLKLSYPDQPKNIVVRIYDHAGRLNLRRLAPHQMQALLKRYVDEDDNERLNELLSAWQDWIDPDDLARANGAETDYYEELDPPYEPRNGLLETVEEIILIKGFDEVFSDTDLNNSFTIYGNGNGINPNVATREVLSTIPGLSGKSIEEILVRRREEEFDNNQDFNEFMEMEELNEFLPWVSFNTSQYYTIALQVITPPPNSEPAAEGESESTDSTAEDIAPPATDEELAMSLAAAPPDQSDEAQHAYMVTVQVMGTAQAPKILRVDPYGRLPNLGHEAIAAAALAEDAD